MRVLILAVLAISITTTPVHANWFEKWAKTERLDTARDAWDACQREADNVRSYMTGRVFCWQRPILFKAKPSKEDMKITLWYVTTEDKKTCLRWYYYESFDNAFVYDLQQRGPSLYDMNR